MSKSLPLGAWPLLALILVSSLEACDTAPVNEAQDRAATTVPANEVQLSALALANSDLEVSVAGPAALQQPLRIQGDVKLDTERVASIVARVKGVVRDVRKKMGDDVRRGEGLVTIESKELAAAKMAYIEAEHRVEFAKKALHREEQLLAKKITSKEAFLQKKHTVQEAAIAHATALQRLKVLGFSETSLHKIQEDLESNLTRYTLRAPFAGEIIKKDVTLGEALNEEKEVFVLADLSQVWVEAKLPVGQIAGLQKGQKVKVYSDKTQNQVEGALAYISSLADQTNRTVVVRVQIGNKDGAWKPGMCARLDFPGTTIQVEVSVPASAVHDLEGRNSVFVQKAEGHFEVRAVELGARDAERVEVRSGLASGEKVAAKNSLSLKAEWLNK